MNAGRKILMALGKQGLKGFYFDGPQSRELKKIVEFEAAKKKVADYGYPSVMSAESAEEIVDIIKSEESRKDRKGCLGMVVLEMVFWFLLSVLTCS